MTHETFRKLIHYGKRVRVVTLPEGWLRYQYKKAGKILTRVRVISREDRLEIFPDFEEGEEQFEPQVPPKTSKFLETEEEDEEEEKE